MKIQTKPTVYCCENIQKYKRVLIIDKKEEKAFIRCGRIPPMPMKFCPCCGIKVEWLK